MDLAAVDARLWVGGVIPVDQGVVEQLQDAGWNVDHWMPIRGTGLEQQNAGTAFTQPAGDHAAGGTGADHDVVGLDIGGCGRPGAFLPGYGHATRMLGEVRAKAKWQPANRVRRRARR